MLGADIDAEEAEEKAYHMFRRGGGGGGGSEGVGGGPDIDAEEAEEEAHLGRSPALQVKTAYVCVCPSSPPPSIFQCVFVWHVSRMFSFILRSSPGV
jgi:hypothetical protein